MQLFKNISLTQFLARLIFVILPTALVFFFILWNANNYFSVLKEQWFQQGVYASLGLLTGFVIHQFRFRFLPLFLILIFFFYSIYTGISNYASGEFDGLFISVSFLVFSYLFSTGYIIGWALQRLRYGAFIISGILLTISVILISKTGEMTVQKLLSSLSPIAIYAVYLIFTNENLRNQEESNARFWWRFSKRFLLFLGLLISCFLLIIYLMLPQITMRIEEYGGGAKEGEQEMLQKNKDGSVENKESMGMGSNNKKNQNPEPLFCAHIDSYLPGTDIPNPLYLTAFHFTKYDSLTETFERDTLFQDNDEFLPDPSRIPLFFTYRDSSRIKKAMGTKRRHVVELEIYKKRLSPSAFVAPSTAFFVQPITVEKDFQKEFKSAYRAKSYVSDLNSAYFIYNSDDPSIRQFQEQRFSELRKARNYEDVDPSFLKYYTYFPANGVYRPIQDLADSLARGKKTTIDKILAVRDYFLQKNALGEQVYAYSDNPGIPGLPSASKLNYFLFESKKGYCAYYAGATVFLLRSMGIPSRVVTGFLTVDRSDKNTGWYWFYEDQSHGWVQVYFPEYGWIDFDTTVGNEDAEQSPTPDGTPPMQPPNPVFAVAGKILSVDTLKRLARIRASDALFKDKEYSGLSDELEMDLKIARIWKDSIIATLDMIKKGDDVMCVSYAQKLKIYNPENRFSDLVKKMPEQIPMDEIYIKTFKPQEKKPPKEEETLERKVKELIIGLLIGLGILIVLIGLLPWIIYHWYKWRSRSGRSLQQKAYYTYRAAGFLLNQMGLEKGKNTYWQYAQRTDSKFGTHFTQFMKIYLHLKYANEPLNELEQTNLEAFLMPFEKKLQTSIPFWQRVKNWLNLNHFIRFYQYQDPEEKNEQ